MLLMDVSVTLVPMRCRHSPMRSCQGGGGGRWKSGSSRQSKGEAQQRRNNDHTAANIYCTMCVSCTYTVLL